MLVDFEKEFDSVSFEFIMATLDLFEFGEIFKTLISIILGMEPGKNFNAVTVINWNISKPLEIQRGADKEIPLQIIFLF